MIKDDYWTMVEKEERALSEKEYERTMMELEIEDALEDGRIERIGKMDITDTGIKLIGEARGSVENIARSIVLSAMMTGRIHPKDQVSGYPLHDHAADPLKASLAIYEASAFMLMGVNDVEQDEDGNKYLRDPSHVRQYFQDSLVFIHALFASLDARLKQHEINDEILMEQGGFCEESKEATAAYFQGFLDEELKSEKRDLQKVVTDIEKALDVLTR